MEDGNYFAYHADELPHIFQSYTDFDGLLIQKKANRRDKIGNPEICELFGGIC